MARYLSNVKLISGLVVNEVSFALKSRGYAAASQGVATISTGVTRTNVVAKKQTGTSSSWVPDPKTGHYMPENHANEIDVAELRRTLLKQRSQ